MTKSFSILSRVRVFEILKAIPSGFNDTFWSFFEFQFYKRFDQSIDFCLNLDCWRKYWFPVFEVQFFKHFFRKVSISKISIFYQNFYFWPNFRSWTKIYIFDEKFDFWPKFFRKFRKFIFWINVSILPPEYFFLVDFSSRKYRIFFDKKHSF